MSKEPIQSTDNKNEEIWNQKYQDTSTEFYEWSPTGRWANSIIEDMLCPYCNNIRSVIDIGCGNGQKTAFIARKLPGAEVFGIDFSEQGISLAIKSYVSPGKQSNLSFRCINVEDDSPYKRSYDLVFSYHVLEHVEDWRLVLRKMARCSDNFVLVCVPIGNKLYRKEKEVFGHFRRFKPFEITNFLKDEGFELVEERAPGFPIQTMHDALTCSFSRYNNVFMEDMSQKVASPFFRFYSNSLFLALKHLCTKKRLGKYWFGLYVKQNNYFPDRFYKHTKRLQ